jgi:hypothetical protein
MIKKLRKMIRDENGQAFPMALVVLAMGSLFVAGFLTSVDTGLLTSKIYSRPVPFIYTADAGVEDALWGLWYGTLAEMIQDQGGEVTYALTEPVNGTTAEITVAGSQGGTVASDDFEEHNWGGGTGWLYPWYHQGSIQFGHNSNHQYQGTYYLQIRGSNAYLDRAADLSGYTNLRLQFYAKARSFERNDEMYCLVSPDDTHWTVVQVWRNGDDDNQYHFFDIDLSPYEMSGEFWIAFDSEMGDNSDYFYIDDLKITGGSSYYEIISDAGEKTTTVTLEMNEGSAVILSWETE